MLEKFCTEMATLLRAFRLSIHPGKLAVALLVLVGLYLTGRTFDLVWGRVVFEGEIEAFATNRSDVFGKLRQERSERTQGELVSMLLMIAGEPKLPAEVSAEKLVATDPAQALAILRTRQKNRFYTAINESYQRQQESESFQANNPGAFSSGLNALPPAQRGRQDRTAAANQLESRLRDLDQLAGQGIFASLLKYESNQLEILIQHALHPVRWGTVRFTGSQNLTETQSLINGLFPTEPTAIATNDTLLGTAIGMVYHPLAWLVVGTAPAQGAMWPEAHWTVRSGMRLVYWGSLGVLLLVWSGLLVGGGAWISRMTALELSGQTDTEWETVTGFVRTQWRRYATTLALGPTLLLALVVVGFAVGLVGAIPWLGALLSPVLMVVTLALGLLIALLIIGYLGAGHTLLPAVSYDDADAFDAVTRCGAFTLQRPWRTLTYLVVSAVYGCICLLAVTALWWLIMTLTHSLLGAGMSLWGNVTADYNGVDKLTAIWPKPEFAQLVPAVNLAALSWSEYIGAMGIMLIAYTLATLPIAFALSFYHTATTIIYGLLRQATDGFPLHEVYVPSPVALPVAPKELSETNVVATTVDNQTE
jgi:hypothetical protein